MSRRSVHACMRRHFASVLGLLALAAAPAQAAVSPAAYAAILETVQTEQATMQARWAAADDAETRTELLAAARATVFRRIAHDLIPAWKGTPWEFWGTTQTPGVGEIACGYYVSTILRDAGFEVERVKLAQQASERIIITLTPRDRIWRTSDATVERSLRPLEEHGDGIYMVGLDYHVGLLVREGGETLFCDSSYINPSAVLCQPPDEAASYTSRYRVVGQLLTDPMMEAWLEGQPLPTFTGKL